MRLLLFDQNLSYKLGTALFTGIGKGGDKKVV